MKTVKCVEKFFLSGFFSYNKLNIIDEKNINISVFFTEFAHCRVVSVSDGFDQFICEFLTGYIENPAVFVVFQYKMSDGMHKMRFSETGSAVNKQRIVGIPRRFGNCESCCLGEFVVASYNEGVEGVFWI